jgi:hypothetical protein
LLANAMRKNESAVPAIETTSNGFLPYASDNLPITGVAKNWHKEKIENNKPFWKSVRPNLWEYEYKIGIIIPYPNALTIAIRAIIARFLFCLNMLIRYFSMFS